MTKRLTGTIVCSVNLNYVKLAELAVWAEKRGYNRPTRSGLVRLLLDELHQVLLLLDELPVRVGKAQAREVLEALGFTFGREALKNEVGEHWLTSDARTLILTRKSPTLFDSSQEPIQVRRKTAAEQLDEAFGPEIEEEELPPGSPDGYSGPTQGEEFLNKLREGVEK